MVSENGELSGWFTSPSDCFNTISMWIVFVISILLPGYASVWLYQHHNELGTANKLESMGPFYEEYKLRKVATAQFTIIMLLRRILMAFVLLLLKYWPCFQSGFLIALSITSLCLLIHIKPYRDPFAQNIELFNEGTVLAVTYCHYLFLYELHDRDKSRELKNILSWCLVVAITTNMIVNVVVVSIKALV